MDDLRSSINERREAGQTDAEDLCRCLARQSRPRQSLPRSCRATRSAKARCGLVCLGAAVLALLAGLLKTVTNLRGFASVGVIGGADGPTEIFIAGRRFLIGQT